MARLDHSGTGTRRPDACSSTPTHRRAHRRGAHQTGCAGTFRIRCGSPAVLLGLTFRLVTRGERAGQGTSRRCWTADASASDPPDDPGTSRCCGRRWARRGPDCRGRLIIGRRGLVEVELGPRVADPGAAGPVRPAGVGSGKRIGIGAAAITRAAGAHRAGVDGGTGVDRAPRRFDEVSSASAVGGAAATTRSDSAASSPAATTVPAPAQAPADRHRRPAGRRLAGCGGAGRADDHGATDTASKSAAGGCHPNYGG